MNPPRLIGPRVALVPVPRPVAVAVVSGSALDAALAACGLRAGAGWPHADTADAVQPCTADADAAPHPGWLVVVDGEVVGECGWKGPPDAEGAVEIAYGLGAPHRGIGLGTEAVAVLVTWTEQQADVRQVVAEALVGNEPSRALLRRLGFEEEPARPPWVRAVRRRDGGRLPVRGRHVC